MNGCSNEVTRQLLEVHGNAKLLHAMQTSTDLVLMKSPLIQAGADQGEAGPASISLLYHKGEKGDFPGQKEKNSPCEKRKLDRVDHRPGEPKKKEKTCP